MQNDGKQDDLYQLAGSKLTSPNNWVLSTNNDTELELKSSGDCFFAHVHTNAILFWHLTYLRDILHSS